MTVPGGIYYYLISQDGQMIYHPRRADIDRGYFSENCEMTSQLEDGTYELSLNGRPGNVVVSSVAYTGWKMIGVIPESVQTASINQFRYYIIYSHSDFDDDALVGKQDHIKKDFASNPAAE